MLCELHKLKIFSVCRKPTQRQLEDPNHRLASGVTILIHNPALKGRLLSQDPKGALCIEVKEVGFEPLAIIAVYIPPHSSPVEHWTRPLFTFVTQEHHRLREKYQGNIVVIGDFNIRLGNLMGRHSMDTNASSSPMRRRNLLMQLCRDCDISPIHGRDPASPAPVTSRHIDPSNPGTSEIDYIMMSNTLPPTSAPIGPVVDWLSIPDGITHRPITACIHMTPMSKDHTNPCYRTQWLAHRNNITKRPPPLVPYDDSRYHLMAHMIQAEINKRNLLEEQYATSTPPATMLDDIRDVLLQSQTCLQSTTPQQSSEQASAADPIKASLPYHHSPIFRRHQGNPLPAKLGDLCRTNRRLFSVLKQAASTEGKDSQAAIDAKAALQAHLKKSRSLIRAHHKASDQKLLGTLEHLRQKDPRRLFQVLKKLAPADGLVLSSVAPSSKKADEPGHAPATERFYQAFRQQFSGVSDPPPAINDERWLSLIKTAPAGDLWSSPITTEEVYLIVFPTSKAIRPADNCPGVGNKCKLCSRYRQKLDSWNGDPDCADINPPKFTPHLNSGVGGGPDGIRPELLMWARPGPIDGQDYKPEDRMMYRTNLSKILANLFNRIRTDGTMPDNATMNRTVAIAKQAKPGCSVNPNDPNDNRGITMGDVIPKILGLVIAKRLMHWVVAHRIVSEEQIGFMEGKGCEDHVFALTECVKSQWRNNRPAYALFVDISKAYDCVQPTALWTVLRRCGLPTSLVDLLSDWSSKRITRVNINGIDSDTIPMLLGLGQGDVLSPLLYNIFTDGMTRYINRCVDFNGIQALGFTFKELKYADDSVFLASSREQLTIAAKACFDWCTAWNMTISTGKRKTEWMFFPTPPERNRGRSRVRPTIPCNPPETDPPPDIAVLDDIPLGNSGLMIQHTDNYRYLGLTINPTLDFSEAQEATLAKIQSAWNRYFVFSGAVRKANITMAFQLFRTLVAGAGTYLMCAMEPTQSFIDRFDTLCKSTARTILHLPRDTPVAILWGESRLMPGEALMARERHRFLYKLTTSTFPADIASKLACNIYAPLLGRHTTADKHPSISIIERNVHLASFHQKKYGVSPVLPMNWLQVSSCAAKYGRDIGYNLWRKAGLKSLLGPPTAPSVVATDRDPKTERKDLLMGILRGEIIPGPDKAYLPRNPKRPTNVHSAHYAGFLYGSFLRHTRQPARPRRIPDSMDGHAAVQPLGPPPYSLRSYPRTATPLSVKGPNGSGSILAITNTKLPVTTLSYMTRMWLGRPGLYTSPIAPAGKGLRDVLARTPTEERNAAISRWKHDVSAPVQCHRCNGKEEDPFHVLTECTQPEVVTARRSALTSLTPLLQLILIKGCAEVLRSLKLHLNQAKATLEIVLGSPANSQSQDPTRTPTSSSRKLPSREAATQQHRKASLAFDEATLLRKNLKFTITGTEELHAQGNFQMWDTDAGRFVLFHLLVMCPWPSTRVPDEPADLRPPNGKADPTQLACYLAKSLALFFDRAVAKSQKFRQIANKWAIWSTSSCSKIAQAWAGPRPPPRPLDFSPSARPRRRHHDSRSDIGDFIVDDDESTSTHSYDSRFSDELEIDLEYCHSDWSDSTEPNMEDNYSSGNDEW